MSKEHIKVWSMIITGTVVLSFMCIFTVLTILKIEPDFNVFIGGLTLPAFIFALLDNVICLGMIFILIPIFKTKFNDQGSLLKNLSTSSFHMYLIHAPILIAISLIFASIQVFAVIKFAIVFPLAVFLCYLASHLTLKKIL